MGRRESVRVDYYQSLSGFCDQIPNKSTFRKEQAILAHNLRIWSFITRKTWRQEPEAADHLSLTQKAEREGCWGLASFPHFSESESPSLRTLSPTCRVFLSTSLNLIQIPPHRYIKRLVSSVIQQLVRLTTTQGLGFTPQTPSHSISLCSRHLPPSGRSAVCA